MILVNGQPTGIVDAGDRGLAYGDGVFRTLRTRAGQPLWWRDHYRKLAADCAALGLACPDEARLHAEVCGAAVAGALQIAQSIDSGTIAVILPDRGDRYLSTTLFRSVCACCPP